MTHKPFVSLAGLVVAVALVLRVLLVDAVVGQVHELVTQSLHGRRIPEEEKHSSFLYLDPTTFPCLIDRLSP